MIDPSARARVAEPDFGALFDVLPSPSMALTPDLTVVAANAALLRATGVRREQVLGYNLFQVFPENPEQQDADGRANIAASVARVLARKERDVMAVQRYDVLAEDGSGYVERHWKLVHLPVFGEDGGVRYVVQHSEDVTQCVKEAAQAAELRTEISAQAQKLREQHLMAELFQQAPVFMAMLEGPNHRVAFVNSGYLQLIGHRNILGMTVAEGLAGAGAQDDLALLDQVFLTGKPYVANGAKYVVQAAPYGPVSERYVDFVYQPMRRDDGVVTGILVQGIDVTERVQTEVRRNALVRLGDAVRNHKLPEDVIVQACVILGETLGVSRVGYGAIDPEAETLTVDQDWTAPGVDTLVGTLRLRDYGSFIDDLKLGNMVAIDDVEGDPRTRAAALALQGRYAGAFVNVPLSEHGKLVAVIFVNNAAARQWTEEELALIREVAERARTTSERLRSEIALRLSEARFRTIADAMPQMVWSTLTDGSHDYYNQRWYDFTGVPPGSTHGDAWNGLLHAEDQGRARDIWHQSLASGGIYEIEYRLRHASGEYRWVLARALPIRDDTSAIIRWMGTCTDIHAQKLAEAGWRQASQRKDEFLAMLAHELRNPLAPISTAAQLLKLRGGHEPHVQQASDIIIRQVRHMTELVDDLLDVSRVTRGLVQLAQQDLDVQAIVSGALEQARPLIDARQHVLSLRLPPAPLHVRGDKTRLVQALANLLNNAAKYTPPGGWITLAVAPAFDAEQPQVAISVTDNGIGMAPELLPRVFDLFTQAERTPDRAQGGLGLGLALVKSIASLHGGSAGAASGGAGHGSTFTIVLPLLATTMALPPSVAVAPAPVAAPVGSLRLMIVDDNQDAAQTLGALMEAHGHRVLVFEDAESALRASADKQVDAYILDIGLPDMDGYELARRLRANPANNGKLLIALTGYGQAQDRVLSSAAGFDHHFVKPVDHAQLARVLVPGG
ncbi:MAG: PAS domain-containing protein [Duganella sp.]